MKAALLDRPAPVNTNPLAVRETETPTAGTGGILSRGAPCGVCRPDSHGVGGQPPAPKLPVIPGHQVVGTIESFGAGSKSGATAEHKFKVGDRVGVAWLHHTDGTCQYCRAGMENLCDHPTFTGYTVDGGYAEYVVADE